MKAKVFEIKRFAVHDGDGIRTTLFLKGCPLKCIWCHNPEGIGFKPQLAYYEHKCIGCGECVGICPTSAQKIKDGVHIFERNSCIACGKCTDVCLGDALKLYGQEMSVNELVPILLEDKDFYDASGGGVTISGGECLAHADFCRELLSALKKAGVSTAVDTCGLVSRESLDKVIPYTDVFLYDVKAVSEDVHIRCTGQSNKLIIDNLRYLNERGCKVELRIPYVPGYNSNEIEKIASLIAELDCITKVRVLAYHNYAGSKYSALGMTENMPEILPTDEEMNTARQLVHSITGLTVIE